MGAFLFFHFWTGFCQMMVKIIVHTVYLGDPHACVRWESTLLPLDFRSSLIYLDAFWHTGWWWRWSSQQMSALLLLHLTIFTHLLSKGSCRCCAACACYSELSVLRAAAKTTCSVEFCWPPSDSQICFMSLNFCIRNYFVHKTSEWFSFCLFSKKP